jgi:hypothetical protein
MKLSVFQQYDYEDSEDVPVVLASHIGGVYRIGPSTIQVTMVNKLCVGGQDDHQGYCSRNLGPAGICGMPRLLQYSSSLLERLSTPAALRKAMRKVVN